MTIKNNELEKTWVQLVDQFPFYATILTNFRVSQDEHLPACAGVYVKNQLAHLKINPEMFLKLSPTIRIGVLEHEIMHVILIHQDRKGTRNHHMFNIACDLSINKNLVPEKLLPKECCFYDKDPFNLPAGQTAEEYYRLIMDDPKKKEKIESMFGSRKIILVDDHGVWTELGDECGLSPDLVRDMIKDAVSKVAGNVPSEISHLVDELLKPAKIPWKQVVQQFVSKHVKGEKEHSWKRMSRRLPGLVQGRKKALVPKLAALIDASGSISGEQLDSFFNELRHLHKTKCPVHIIVFDVEVHDSYLFDGKSFREVKARGGTSFVDAFRLINKMRDISAAIVLTDLYGGHIDASENRIQTLWVCTKDSADETSVPFGKCIKIDV